MQKKFLLYEDFIFEIRIPLKTAAAEEIESDEEENQTKGKKTPQTPPSKPLIDFHPDTKMGQMQKLFGWDRDQQEWAQKMLRDN